MQTKLDKFGNWKEIKKENTAEFYGRVVIGFDTENNSNVTGIMGDAEIIGHQCSHFRKPTRYEMEKVLGFGVNMTLNEHFRDEDKRVWREQHNTELARGIEDFKETYKAELSAVREFVSNVLKQDSETQPQRTLYDDLNYDCFPSYMIGILDESFEDGELLMFHFYFEDETDFSDVHLKNIQHLKLNISVHFDDQGDMEVFDNAVDAIAHASEELNS